MACLGGTGQVHGLQTPEQALVRDPFRVAEQTPGQVPSCVALLLPLLWDGYDMGLLAEGTGVMVSNLVIQFAFLLLLLPLLLHSQLYLWGLPPLVTFLRM